MIKVLLALALVVFAFSSCASTEPTRFYLLTPEAKPTPILSSTKESRLVIIIGAVRLPEYLNRSQIVTRVSDNELELGWQDRWAEPLERNVTRIVAQNIEQLLSCRCASAPIPKLPPGITYRVETDVIGMDGILGRQAFLDVWWSVYTPEKKPLLSRKSRFTQPVKGSGYEAFVRAQSIALFDFSREVASAIAELEKERTMGR